MRFDEEELRRWDESLRKWQLELQEREIKLNETSKELEAWEDGLQEEQNKLDGRERNFVQKSRTVEKELGIKKMELDAANVPLVQVLEEVLLLLELETDLAHIADMVRERTGIIDVKW